MTTSLDKWTHRTTNLSAFMSGSNRVWLKGRDPITFVCDTACPLSFFTNGIVPVKNAAQIALCHCTRTYRRRWDLYLGSAECFSIV